MKTKVIRIKMDDWKHLKQLKEEFRRNQGIMLNDSDAIRIIIRKALRK